MQSSTIQTIQLFQMTHQISQLLQSMSDSCWCFSIGGKCQLGNKNLEAQFFLSILLMYRTSVQAYASTTTAVQAREKSHLIVDFRWRKGSIPIAHRFYSNKMKYLASIIQTSSPSVQLFPPPQCLSILLSRQSK